MGQVRITDVAKALEQLEVRINARLNNIEQQLNRNDVEGDLLQKFGVTAGITAEGDLAEEVQELRQELAQVRDDLVGHVGVYNNHIRASHQRK